MSSNAGHPLAKALPLVQLIATQGDEPAQMANRIYLACAPCDKTLEQRVAPDFEINPDYEEHIDILCTLAAQGAEEQLAEAVRVLSDGESVWQTGVSNNYLIMLQCSKRLGLCPLSLWPLQSICLRGVLTACPDRA